MGGAPKLRAVIFDLWDTLALWPGEDFERVKLELSEHIDDFDRVWDTTYNARQVGSIESYFRGLGLEDETLAKCLRLRSRFTQDALVPREGAIATLEELKRRGFKRGLISVCSSDVEEAWAETELAPHLDDFVLSCTVGLTKPDPRIYELACERLEVSPDECIFVGDGANDELAGAERVGMRAVCVLPPGRDEPIWPEARGWEPTITSLEEVLTLAGATPAA
jgi:putative hydrolase of the HAD superfamily